MAELVIRLDRELWLFVAPRRRRRQVEVTHDGTASLGHVVEALGVPLTEVGRLRVDGAPAGPSHLPRPGATIDVQPMVRPQAVPGWAGTFLLDVHLGTLARRLRILGVDTAYRSQAGDDELVGQAGTQHRLLLTQDRGLLKRRALWAGAYVRGSRADDQLADVLDRFAPPLRPWTRCTACNGALAAVPKHEVADQLEPGTRCRYDQFARCRSCGRVYWHGAHGRRLDSIVAAARALAAHPRRSVGSS
ncbi:MAG: Mut7-C RNAse domain-containing protein [Pseudonocardiaceae bacterium]